MELPDYNTGRLGVYQAISFIIFPFFTNLSLLLFIIYSIDIYASSSMATNIIGVIAIVLWYLAGLIEFFVYGRITNGWSDLFGGNGNVCMVLTLLVTYPVFYLFWLPLIVYQLLVFSGSPKGLWERIFHDSCMSLDNLIPELNNSTGSLICHYIYIGVPFFIFALIYIAILVFLAPVWYFFLSPLGMGTVGICLHVSLHFPQTRETDLNERIIKSYRLGSFVQCYFQALPLFILGIIYMIFATPAWWAIVLTFFSGLHFLIDFFPTSQMVCCGQGEDMIY